MIIITSEYEDEQNDHLESEVPHDPSIKAELKSATKKFVEKRKIESVSQKKLQYNVYFPTKNQQVYYPMLELKGLHQKVINELELIRTAVQVDKQNPQKHVTTFYFFSPPGLGKTVLGGYLAYCYNSPYQIINCVNSMIDLDLLGNQILQGEDTLWQDGPLPSIIRATNDYGMGILIINELNALTVNAQMALNPLLDRQEGVVLTQNNNEFVHLEKENHLLILASMNPDVFGIHDLQDSVRDRASAIIEMNYPPLEKEIDLIMKLTGLNEEIARKYCEVIAECRRAKYIDQSLTKAPSTRALLDWIYYSAVWGSMLAFEMTIANRYCSGYNQDERQILLRLATGKGVVDWKYTEDLQKLNGEILPDTFHFPTLQPIKREISPKIGKDKLTKGQKKAQKLEKLASRLSLGKLDEFMSSPDLDTSKKK